MQTKLLASLALIALAAGCSDGAGPGAETGRLTLRLGDAPNPAVQSAVVYVSRAYVVPAQDNGSQFTITDVPQSFDLLSLQNGVTTLLGSADIPVGEYSQLRLVVDSARVTLEAPATFTDGSSTALLKVPSGAQSGLKVNFAGPITVTPGETVLVVDFDVQRSFVFTGPPGGPHGVIFKPVLHAVVADVAGSISGTVSPGTSSAALYAIQGSDTVRSTVADPVTGAYTLHFLAPGSYVVGAIAAGFQPDSVENVVVGPAQQVTGVDFTLVP